MGRVRAGQVGQGRGQEDSPCRRPRRPGSAGCAPGDTSPAWGQRAGTESEGSGSLSCGPRARQASPLHHPRRALEGTYASLGPPWLRSKTCRGFRYQRKDWMILAPCGKPGADREVGRHQGWGAEVGKPVGPGRGKRRRQKATFSESQGKRNGAEADLGIPAGGRS